MQVPFPNPVSQSPVVLNCADKAVCSSRFPLDFPDPQSCWFSLHSFLHVQSCVSSAVGAAAPQVSTASHAVGVPPPSTPPAAQMGIQTTTHVVAWAEPGQWGSATWMELDRAGRCWTVLDGAGRRSPAGRRGTLCIKQLLSHRHLWFGKRSEFWMQV